jgi:hypothetical protein
VSVIDELVRRSGGRLSEERARLLAYTVLFRGGPGSFNPASLFAANEPGVWYDPSDLTTLFQDTAGTTPVTAPGQNVALMLDKSRGLTVTSNADLVTNGGFASDTNWVDASTGTGTAVISGGILTVTSNAIPNIGERYQEITTVAGQWYRLSWNAVSGSQHQVAVGTTATGTDLAINTSATTVTSILFRATTASAFIRLRTNNTITGISPVVFDNIVMREFAAGNHATQATLAQRPTYGVVPATGRRNLLINTTTLATQNVTVAAGAHTLSFTGTGSVTLSGTATGTLTGTGANDRVSLTATTTSGTLTLTVSGSVTLAQLETGSAVTAYQRVGTAFDVTEQNVPTMHYLSFDGSDDWMVTGNIVPGIDKAQVFAGVRKLSDVASGTIAELSANAQINNGAFELRGPRTAGTATYRFLSVGTLNIDTFASGFTAPITNVVTGLGNISAPSAILRVDGTQVASNTATQGTGNYLTYPLYIGRRSGTTFPFNGQLYGLIVRFGTNLPAATITQTERYIGQRVAPTVTI